tara:strand:- start:222 stop:521 length:300 start_codon:yes stop_codon:yes gene_type:complete
MTPKEAQRFTKLLHNTDDMTPLEKAEVGRLRTAYLTAVAHETEAYIAAKETYEDAKKHLDMHDPGEREVLMTLLKSMRDGEKNVLVIAAELETHFGISA